MTQSLPACLTHTFVGDFTCIYTAYALIANTGEAEYITKMHLEKNQQINIVTLEKIIIIIK